MSASLRAELVARIDRVIELKPLTREGYSQLFQRSLLSLKERLVREAGVMLEVDPSVGAFLCDAAVGQTEGARGFLKVFELQLANPVFHRVAQSLGSGTIKVGVDLNRITVRSGPTRPE